MREYRQKSLPVEKVTLSKQIPQGCKNPQASAVGECNCEVCCPICQICGEHGTGTELCSHDGTMINVPDLRKEALEVGDLARVELCDQALAGDPKAISECSYIIHTDKAKRAGAWIE